MCFLLLLSTSCSLFENDLDNPNEFLLFRATSKIVESAPNTLGVTVQVANVHPMRDAKLGHSSCPITARIITDTGEVLEQPTYICLEFLTYTRLKPRRMISFGYALSIDDSTRSSLLAGSYQVRATTHFIDMPARDFPAGPVVVAVE